MAMCWRPSTRKLTGLAMIEPPAERRESGISVPAIPVVMIFSPAGGCASVPPESNIHSLTLAATRQETFESLSEGPTGRGSSAATAPPSNVTARLHATTSRNRSQSASKLAGLRLNRSSLEFMRAKSTPPCRG